MNVYEALPIVKTVLEIYNNMKTLPFFILIFYEWGEAQESRVIN